MRKIYVGNIPYDITEEDLKELFSEYGEIESIRIVKDQFTGRCKGYAFVEMVKKMQERQLKHSTARISKGGRLLWPRQSLNRKDRVLAAEAAVTPAGARGKDGDSYRRS
jgi:hypothetical protein